MKKYLVILGILAIMIVPAIALAVTLDVTEVEVSKVDQVDQSLSGGRIDDASVTDSLLVIGKTLSSDLVAYAVIGNRKLELTEIKSSTCTIEEDDVVLGIGARGEVAELWKGSKLSYDARYSGVNTDSVEQRALDISLIVSKEIAVNKPYIVSVTPSVGYKFTNQNLRISETNYNNDLSSIIGGVKAIVSDKIAVSVGASIGDEDGIEGKVSYQF